MAAVADAASQMASGGVRLGKRGADDADERARAWARTDGGEVAQARLRMATTAASDMTCTCTSSMAAAVPAPAAAAVADGGDGGAMRAAMAAATAVTCAPARRKCDESGGVATQQAGGVRMGTASQPLQTQHDSSMGALGAMAAVCAQQLAVHEARAGATAAMTMGGAAHGSRAAAAVATRDMSSPAATDAPDGAARRVHKRAAADDAVEDEACTLSARGGQRRRHGDVEHDATTAAEASHTTPTLIEAASLHADNCRCG